jgi:hypothetical protein
MKHIALVLLVALFATSALSQSASNYIGGTWGYCDTVTTSWTKIFPLYPHPKPYMVQVAILAVSGSGNLVIGGSYKVNSVLQVDTASSTNGVAKTTLLWNTCGWIAYSNDKCYLDTVYIKTKDGSALIQMTAQ